jgi:hypothetical protein
MNLEKRKFSISLKKIPLKSKSRNAAILVMQQHCFYAEGIWGPSPVIQSFTLSAMKKI